MVNGGQIHLVFRDFSLLPQNASELQQFLAGPLLTAITDQLQSLNSTRSFNGPELTNRGIEVGCTIGGRF